MPEVLEVADRIQVMRLGTRVVTLPSEGTTVSNSWSGAMTGALDFSKEELSMSVITPQTMRGRRCR